MRYTALLLNSMASTTTNWNKLSRAWVNDFALPSTSKSPSPQLSKSSLQTAIQRTLPLLNEDPITSVPFICRYRTDVIHPLSTKQVFQLSDYIQKYQSLSTLRNKILQCLASSSNNNQRLQQNNETTVLRVETSISKSELDDIYAPFKPPAKGTLEERIKTECPELVVQIDGLWSRRDNNNNDDGVDDYDYQQLKKMLKIYHDKAVILLANRIAGDANVIDAIMDQRKYCRVQVKQSTGGGGSRGSAKASSTKGKSASRKSASSAATTTTSTSTYHDYNNKISNIQDHQVLAIRRGVDQKALKLTFELNDDHVKRTALQALHASSNNNTNNNHAFVSKLYRDALEDAWTRLLRKRCTSRLWKEKCQHAELRAIEVFCENLNKALLAPPAAEMIGGDSNKALLALDPGFKAGIKAAILSSEGKTLVLETIKFLGGATEREEGKRKLSSLLERVQQINNNGSGGSSNDGNDICVVLGNGHGTREARQLLKNVTSQNSALTVDIHLVSEAGASVWSVTEAASDEFPKETPASIAAVSIGRRYLNPLAELVKVPPKSLGLGMYQHDLSEKVLDDKLTLTSIDCVAEVGVDVNSCSLAILQKVPSLTKTLAQKVFNARPLKSRKDLLRVKGLGDKTYENAAAFIRVAGGVEPLDNTMVHPESYDLARWLLKELQWELNDATSAEKDRDSKDEVLRAAAKKAAKKCTVSEDRAHSVIEHLFFSITSPDPRTRKNSGVASTSRPSDIGSAAGCAALSSGISTADKLRDFLPHRNIIGTVRNVVDFGAFIDFGLENDGLLHRSKLGPVNLGSLLVGQDIGVDILGVSKDNKISLGLAGLNFPVDDADAKKRSLSSANGKRGDGPVSKKKRRK
mmetsp:Transcript_11597/g.23233  ORF Transcript_11597/g.23233 Transcript_11597/m.23233 type:complete len:864 (+) Transcript_11597:73-2664(+)